MSCTQVLSNLIIVSLSLVRDKLYNELIRRVDFKYLFSSYLSVTVGQLFVTEKGK